MVDDRTVIVEKGRGGGARWFVGIAIILAVVVGVLLFSRMTGSEVSKDNAVANAADQVGSAARKAGDAAEDAAGKVNP